MRKFRLIKEYPGCFLKINSIIEFENNCQQIINSNGNFIINDLLKHSEFWEEIVEKDYEILSGRTHIPSGSTEIYSIRRKSDGVEFKIGDKICWNWAFAKNKYFTIKSFNIIEDKLRFNTVEESGQNFIFELISKEFNLQHYKEPILITEDGYECSLDDRVFGVLPKGVWETKFWDGQGMPVNKLFNPEGKRYSEGSPWLYFKTKENAEKYIYENKPEFSRKQILDAIDICDSYYTTHSDNYFIKVSHLKRLLNL